MIFQHDTKNGGVLHLKIIFTHSWKKHRDLHLLPEKPWGSSAHSWLILLDIRHCLFKLHNVLIPPCTGCFLALSVWICCHASSCMHIEQRSQVTLIANSILSFGMSLLYSGCETRNSVHFSPYLVSMFNVVGKPFVLELDWEKLWLVSLRIRHVNILLTCYIEKIISYRQQSSVLILSCVVSTRSHRGWEVQLSTEQGPAVKPHGTQVSKTQTKPNQIKLLCLKCHWSFSAWNPLPSCVVRV